MAVVVVVVLVAGGFDLTTSYVACELSVARRLDEWMNDLNAPQGGEGWLLVGFGFGWGLAGGQVELGRWVVVFVLAVGGFCRPPVTWGQFVNDPV
jgi:hypothetical protein